jgi:O-antigen ligase
VAVKSHGAPVVIGLVVPLLLVVPLAYHLFRGARPVITPAFCVLVLFLVAQAASASLSVSAADGTEDVKTFVVEAVLVYFLLTNVIRTPEALRRASWAVMVAGGLLGALSLFQEVTGTHAQPYGGFALIPPEFFSGHSDKARLAGPLGDPNYYAQILLPVLPLALFRLWGERSVALRIAAVACAAFATAGILLSYSRGAGLAFAAIFALMVAFRYVRARHIAFVVVGIVIALVALPEYTERLRTVGDVASATSESGSGEAEAADISVRSRLTEMLTAWLVFTDHPVLGVGPTAFGEYYGEYSARIGIEVREEVKFGARKGEAPERESHNMLLSIAAELGLIGLVLFLAILYYTLRDLVRARRRWLEVRPEVSDMITAMLLAVVGYVTAGVFLTLAFERYFWLLIALAGAASLLRPDDDDGAVAAPRR